MSEGEIKRLIHFDSIHESKLAIPNYLFNDLMDLAEEGILKKNHIGFTFSYCYLMAYLYRYSKYQYYIPRTEEIKAMLGISKTNSDFNYIMKKNGVLENKLLVTTNDFPILSEFKEVDYSLSKELVIYTMSSYTDEIEDDGYYIKKFKEEKKIGRNQYCKLPIFGFYIYPEYLGSGEPYDGTFYNSDRTVIIDFDTFLFCVCNKELGVNAFYLYSYLKKQEGIFENFNATRERISNETGISSRSVQNYLNKLRSYNMIKVLHNIEYFSLGLNKADRKANTYKVNDYSDFTKQKVSYNKIRYVKANKHEEGELISDMVEEGLMNLF